MRICMSGGVVQQHAPPRHDIAKQLVTPGSHIHNEVERRNCTVLQVGDFERCLLLLSNSACSN